MSDPELKGTSPVFYDFQINLMVLSLCSRDESIDGC
jgi:hypothetical protein